MAILLHIETSGAICSVSIAKNETVIAEKIGSEKNDHASQLTFLISSALHDAEIKINALDAIAVSSGPGSYTGLRIGASTAKGICYALQIPVISIPTLQAMAIGGSTYAESINLLCPLIDARRSELFAGIYNALGEEIFKPRPVILQENIFNEFLDREKILFFGSGMEKSKPFLNHVNVVFLDDYLHKASYFAGLAYEKFKNGLFENLAYFEPDYLKPVYTTKSKAAEKD